MCWQHRCCPGSGLGADQWPQYTGCHAVTRPRVTSHSTHNTNNTHGLSPAAIWCIPLGPTSFPQTPWKPSWPTGTALLCTASIYPSILFKLIRTHKRASHTSSMQSMHSNNPEFSSYWFEVFVLWSSGKGKGIGTTQEVTQRSFIDYRLSIIDIDFPMLYTKFGCVTFPPPPPPTRTSLNLQD